MDLSVWPAIRPLPELNNWMDRFPINLRSANVRCWWLLRAAAGSGKAGSLGLVTRGSPHTGGSHLELSLSVARLVEQVRLCSRFRKLAAAGKKPTVVVTAETIPQDGHRPMFPDAKATTALSSS